MFSLLQLLLIVKLSNVFQEVKSAFFLTELRIQTLYIVHEVGQQLTTLGFLLRHLYALFQLATKHFGQRKSRKIVNYQTTRLTTSMNYTPLCLLLVFFCGIPPHTDCDVRIAFAPNIHSHAILSFHHFPLSS